MTRCVILAAVSLTLLLAAPASASPTFSSFLVVREIATGLPPFTPLYANVGFQTEDGDCSYFLGNPVVANANGTVRADLYVDAVFDFCPDSVGYLDASLSSIPFGGSVTGVETREACYGAPR